MKKETTRKRDKHICLMVTQEEKDVMLEHMKRCGFNSLTEYVRRISLGGAILVVDDTDAIQALNYEINKIGNNINQIAHVANINQSVSEADIKQVKELMATVWQYQRYILSGTR